MKKCVIVIVMLSLLLGGCSWMDGEYHSVKPHAAQDTAIPPSGVVVSGFNELQEALVKMVTSGITESTFYVTGFDSEHVDQYMNTAIMHVFQNSAVGAYAVEKINYEFGTRGGRSAIAVDVSYIHGRQEILRIKKTENMDGLKRILEFSLNSCDANMVAKVSNYEQMDLTQYVQDYVNAHPQFCMEMPQVAVAVYPDRGDERVVELSFTYQTSRDALRTMQDMVAPIFSAAEMYVQGSEDDAQKYEQLYAFLMERFEYKLETSITPAYSLLRYGVGDSKAFAMVYSTMCRNAGLECQVISGTKDGEARYWNMIRLGDTYYHVDLLSCSQNGGFEAVASGAMNGYVWDYSSYQ